MENITEFISKGWKEELTDNVQNNIQDKIQDQEYKWGEEKIKENQDWARSEEGQQAFKRITGERPTAKEVAEVDFRTAIRRLKKEESYHSNLEISKIMQEEFDRDDLGNILRELLIKEN